MGNFNLCAIRERKKFIFFLVIIVDGFWVCVFKIEFFVFRREVSDGCRLLGSRFFLFFRKFYKEGFFIIFILRV